MEQQSKRTWIRALSVSVGLSSSLSLACGSAPGVEGAASGVQGVTSTAIELGEPALLGGESSVVLTPGDTSPSGSIGIIGGAPDDLVEDGAGANDALADEPLVEGARLGGAQGGQVQSDDGSSDDGLVVGELVPAGGGTGSASAAGGPALVIGGAPASDAAPLGTADPRVQVLSANGSGCAGQTASVTSVADDLSAFTLAFGGYSVELSAERPFARENCVFMIDVDPPVGFTYAVTAVPLSGRADLQAGATARAGSTYSYQGESETAVITEDVPGGASEWSTPGEYAPDQVTPAPCDAERLLVLNTSLILDGREGGVESTVSLNPEIRVELTLAACE